MCCCRSSGERTLRGLAVAALGGLLFAQAALAQRPLVGVDFHCDEPVYCAGFGPRQREELRRRLSAELAGALGRRFRCFQFVGEGAESRLAVRLDRRSRSPLRSDYGEVVFWISLAASDGSPLTDEIAWPFRAKEDYNLAIGDLSTFETQLCTRFVGHLRDADQRKKLADSILSAIQVSDRAFPIPDTTRWALPFSKEEIGLDLGSLFEVRTSFSVTGGREVRSYEVLASGVTDESVPPEYRAKILADTQRPRGSWPPRLAVEGVFITGYEGLPAPLLRPRPPKPRGGAAPAACFE